MWRGVAVGTLVLARNWGNWHGTAETVPLVNRTLEWGVVIATLWSILSIVPRHCA